MSAISSLYWNIGNAGMVEYWVNIVQQLNHMICDGLNADTFHCHHPHLHHSIITIFQYSIYFLIHSGCTRSLTCGNTTSLW